MKKRGQGEIIGSLILLGLLTLGAIGSYLIVSENRYVGDQSTKIVYDLKYCDIRDISDHKFISFSNLEEASKEGYKNAKCNI